MFESKDSTLGVYNKVDIKQLGYCNAFIRECYLQDSNGYILTKRELVSYCTPVVAITYKLDGTPKQLLCAPACTCSCTTRKHVQRFLRESNVSIGYLGVKTALSTNIGTNNCNGLRMFDIDSNTVYGYDDIWNMFNVRYDSIKPFETWL